MAKGESDFQILHRHLFSRREEFRKGEERGLRASTSVKSVISRDEGGERERAKVRNGWTIADRPASLVSHKK